METLLVEDDEILLKSLSFFLKSKGYKVTGFNNGLDAIAYLENEDTAIDIVITDLNLPFAGGQQLIRKLRQEKGQDIPIIVLTSSGVEATELEVFDLGADEFISKPFSPAVLLKRMEKLLVKTS
ncbi:MAG: response regulator transcription factor [Salinimicrobium sediminis]|nr:response regulator transcription factor [Salinimicrobium sediminis]